MRLRKKKKTNPRQFYFKGPFLPSQESNKHGIIAVTAFPIHFSAAILSLTPPTGLTHAFRVIRSLKVLYESFS